jgi:parvulin-like peptidyl-prolyl isomerase
LKTALRLVLPLSIVLAACGGAGGVAATVDGVEITVEDIQALVAAEGAVDAEFFRTQLQGKIVSLAVLGAAEEEFGITASEEDIETQYQEFKTQLESSAETYEAALEANGITDERVRQAAREQIIADALREQLIDETPAIDEAEVAAELEANSEAYRTGCIRHILLETEEEALEVKARLDGGEDFATVAGETSIEPQAAETGGDLGCSTLNRYVPEFSVGALAAEVGVVTEPVQSEFGYHLILVESIDDDAAVETSIRSQLETVAQQTYFSEWIQETLTSTEITVDEEYGEWVTDPQPGIVPPADQADETPAETPTETTPTTGG